MLKRNKDIDKDGVNEIIHLSQKLLRVFYVIVIIAIVLGVLLVCKQLNFFPFIIGVLKVISPLFIGFILAWLFYPLQRKLIDKGFNNILSAVIILLGIVSVMFLFVYIFIPVLYNQVNELISSIPTIFSKVTTFITDSISKINVEGFDITSAKESVISSGQKLIESITTELPNSLITIIKSIFSALGIILLSLVVTVYMLIDFDNITNGVRNFLRNKKMDDYIKLFDNIGYNVRKVVNGTLLVAFMVFVCDTIGFALVGLDAAVLFGLFCGLTDLIPYIGPYIGGAAAVIVGFTQGPLIGIGVLVVAIIVQLVESYVLQPVVMSKAMQLSPITIIIGLLLFGYFFGIIGMVVATPCMSIIKEVIIFINHKRKEKMEML